MTGCLLLYELFILWLLRLHYEHDANDRSKRATNYLLRSNLEYIVWLINIHCRGSSKEFARSDESNMVNVTRSNGTV